MKLRTQKEIIEKIHIEKNDDFFAVKISSLVNALDYDNAKEFLIDDVKKEDWTPDYTIESIKGKMAEYLGFAWSKANGRRGLSANRSLERYQTWFWLLGEDEISQKMFDDYKHYGKPKLIEITKWLGRDPEDCDDGERVN